MSRTPRPLRHAVATPISVSRDTPTFTSPRLSTSLEAVKIWKKNMTAVAYPTGEGQIRGSVPQISGRGGSRAKVTHFLTHNDTIAGFTS